MTSEVYRSQNCTSLNSVNSNSSYIRFLTECLQVCLTVSIVYPKCWTIFPDFSFHQNTKISRRGRQAVADKRYLRRHSVRNGNCQVGMRAAPMLQPYHSSVGSALQDLFKSPAASSITRLCFASRHIHARVPRFSLVI